MKQGKRLASEVAEASRTTTAPIYIKPTIGNVLIDTAKRLQRLQTKRARLTRDLKFVNQAIRAAKSDLRGLARQIGKGE